VTLSKRFGTLLGGDYVIVSGMSVEEEDIITCSFGKTAVDGLYIGEDQALCVSPPAREEAVMEFTIKITRGPLTLTGGTTFQYSKYEPFHLSHVICMLRTYHSFTR